MAHFVRMTSAFADFAGKDFGSDGVLLARRSTNKKRVQKVPFFYWRALGDSNARPTA